jgi:alkylation response protein AidB-like acyl-CoA dehydrogenase
MDFTFAEHQVGLRDTVRRLGEGRLAAGDPSTLWQVVTKQLDLTGIGIPEADGGAGGDFVDAAVVIEEAGRTLLPAPLTTTLVAGAALVRIGEPGRALARRVAEGDCVAVVAEAASLDVAADGGHVSGTIAHVLDGDIADALLIAATDGLWWVDLRGAADPDASHIEVKPLPTLDPSRGQARVVLDGCTATRLGDHDAARAAVDVLRVALSIEALGAARHCLDLTVSHLKTREQFGRPIGSFQALQHRAADLVVAVEAAASTAYYAAWVAAHSTDELAVVAPAAKSLCGEAAWQVAAEMIQMHGGIGFTWEHPAHRYFKRITTIRLLLGDAHAQRALVAERAGLTADV